MSNQEKSLEQRRDLYLCFVDLEKAFDRVPRAALWMVLKKAGCPAKLIEIVRQLHDGMMARVQHDNTLSDEFPVTAGVKQGCVMAATLFSIYFATVLSKALENCNDSIELNVRSDRSVFDLSRFRAKGRVRRMSVLEVLYADDVCLMADSVEVLKKYLNELDSACRKFGLVISVSKTQILKQSANDTSLRLANNCLKEVTSFRYLGSMIRRDNRLNTEISSRISGAAAAFGKLNQRVWKSHDLYLNTKIDVYKAIILPILLYASEAWCLYKSDIKRLDSFHLKCLRAILRLSWQDRTPNTEVLRRTNMFGMESLLMKGQLRWCGHLARMDDSRIPKAVFYSELGIGKRKSGGQYLRYKDVLKRHLLSSKIPAKKWHELALERQKWRHIVSKGVKSFEDSRLEELDTKRTIRKMKPKPFYNYTYNNNGQLCCSTCNRTFKTKFGFASHIRAHTRK